MSKVFLLGVGIDAVTRDQAMERLRTFLHIDGQHHVMTPNNEMLVEATRNAPFHALLNHTALNIADSTGLLLAARLTGQRLPERVTGVDTVTRLCAALDASHPVFLLGAAPGVAERAAAALQKKNPRLVIAGTFAGSPKQEDAHGIVDRINASGAHILFVAYGAPAQDFWIARHLAAMPSVKLAIGVGGTFDFLAGTAKRAPKILRSVGLEWLWRLFTQPRRFRRIIRAVFLFPLLILRHGRFLREETR